MLRSEKTVPKMSFASSSFVRADCPNTGGTPFEDAISEVGRDDLLEIDAGRGSQRLL